MKRQFFILLVFLISGVVLAQSQEKILFIGNSMTFYNNMPTLFQGIANSKGKNVQTQQYAPGGTGFVNHVNDNNVYNLFASQVWDAVILQPGTGESGGVSFPTSVTVNRGNQLMDSIRKYSPCAKIILYEISNGVAANSSGGGGNYANYFATQTMIKDAMTAIANGMQIPFAPAGECFRHHYTSTQDLLLHPAFNDVHPNLSGSYLVACSVFNTLYQESIVPSNFYGGLSNSNAIYLQNISDQIVLQNKPQWLINTYNLYADFSFLINGMDVQFQNLSTNYDSLTWNINDEHTTNELSPNYSFTSAGIKTITLTAYKNGCLYTLSKQIEVLSLNVEKINAQQSIKVYPNPSSDFIHIDLSEPHNSTFSIIDMNGRVVIQEKTLDANYIDIRFLNQGIYMLNLKIEGNIKSTKLIKI
jgi:hypothetical protein